MNTPNKLNTEKTQYFSSSDMGCVASLMCSGHAIDRIEKPDGKRAMFFIKQTFRLNDLVDKYFANQLQVDALGYFTALRTIKNRLYNVSR